jgi:signal transduction histidine kinase
MRSRHILNARIPGTRSIRIEASASQALARVGWLVVAVLSLGLFAASLPGHYRQLATFTYSDGRNPEAVRVGLDRLGVPIPLYAGVGIAEASLFTLSLVAAGAVIIRRRPRDWMALLFAFTLVTFGVIWPNTLPALDSSPAGLRIMGDLLDTVGYFTFPIFFFLFPDGRFVPRWTAYLTIAVAAVELPGVFWPDSAVAIERYWVLDGAVRAAVLTTAVVAQVYRYRRISGPIERQQTRWAVFGVAVAVTAILATLFFGALVPAVQRPGIPAVLFNEASGPIFLAAGSLIPLTVGIAILRYRLWDIDFLINRTLIYGTLTASVIGLYVLVVGSLGALFDARGNLIISLLATGLVAVLFQPWQQRVQRGINRLLYGEHDDPYAVLSRLGQQLEGTSAPGAALSVIVQTVASALNSPYVAILLRQGERLVPGASSGNWDHDLLHLPLAYQAETVGELLIAPRAAGETFAPADRRLLDDLARQAGIAVYASRLATDLQRSRERLVMAREEERRRLRNDLHDDLGPALSGLMMKLEAARDRLSHDPAADALLADVTTRAQVAVADIRRLVHALRPPALDELVSSPRSAPAPLRMP